MLKQASSYKANKITKKQIRAYKKQTSTNYANKIYDEAGDYSGMMQFKKKGMHQFLNINCVLCILYFFLQKIVSQSVLIQYICYNYYSNRRDRHKTRNIFDWTVPRYLPDLMKT